VCREPIDGAKHPIPQVVYRWRISKISAIHFYRGVHNYGKSPLLMGKSTISMAIFNSYVELPKGSPIAPHSIFTSISIIDSVLFYYQQVAVINHELLHRGIPPNAILL